MTRVGDSYGALDNHCPHQGGPLGEGSIENGWLRCPWHGYDYDPCTGTPPPGFTDAPACFAVEVRDDGVYVGTRARTRARAHRVRRHGRDDGPWGVRHVFGMVGHSNLGFADAMRRAEERGELTLRRHPPRGRGGVRGVSAYGKLTGRPAACFAHRRAGLDQPAHRPVRRQGRPGAGARDLRAGAVEGARPWRVPGPRPRPRRSPTSPAFSADGAGRVRPRRADDARVQARASSDAVSPTSCCPTRCRCIASTTRPRGGPAGRARRPARSHHPMTSCARMPDADSPPPGAR